MKWHVYEIRWMSLRKEEYGNRCSFFFYIVDRCSFAGFQRDDERIHPIKEWSFSLFIPMWERSERREGFPHPNLVLWADRPVSWWLYTPHNLRSPYMDFVTRMNFLANYAQCGKSHSSATCRDLTRECVLCAEPCRGDASQPVSTLVYDSEPPWVHACDGEHLMELSSPDPAAGRGLLLSCCHSGVHPLEQLQHKVRACSTFLASGCNFLMVSVVIWDIQGAMQRLNSKSWHYTDAHFCFM